MHFHLTNRQKFSFAWNPNEDILTNKWRITIKRLCFSRVHTVTPSTAWVTLASSLVAITWMYKDNAFNLHLNHNYNKILESGLLSPAMIWALIGQLGQCNWTVYASCPSNWTVRVRARALMDQLHLNKVFLRIMKLWSISPPWHFVPFRSLLLL